MKRTYLPGFFAVGAAVGLALVLPDLAEGQVCPLAPGCTTTLQEAFDFSSSDQSLWGPGGSDAPDVVTLTLFNETWGGSDGDSDVQTFSGWWGTWKFGGSVSAATSGRIASYFDLTGIGQASVDVDYPVSVAVTIPEINTFRAGDAVTIETAWQLLSDDADMEASFGATDLALRGRFGMHHSADYEICLVSCTGDVPFFPTMDIPEAGFDIFRSVDGSFGIGDQEPTDLESFADFLASTFTGVTAYVQAPDPLGSGSLDGTVISAEGSDEWARLDVDVDAFLRFVKVIPGLPFPPLGACLPLQDYGAFDLCYETVDLDSQYRVIQDESVSFEGSVNVRVDFPVELGYDVVDPDGNTTASGQAGHVSFPVGHSLTVYTPTSVTPVDLTSTVSLESTLTRDAALRLKYWMTNRELQLSFDMAQVSNTSSRHHDADYDWVSCSSIISAGDAGEFFSLLGKCISGAISGTWKKVRDAWTEWVTKTANAIDFDVGPLVEENFAEAESTVPMFSESWELGGFDDFAGPTLTLDPEDPSIAVGTSVAGSAWTTDANHGTVTQTVLVENTGDVPLNGASILDALGAAGATVDLIQSFEITVNAGFDGDGDAEVLAGGQTLGVGESAEVTIRWAAVPGLHTVTVRAQGTSPIYTTVSDAAAAAFGWYAMEIQPDELNRRSNGNTPIHLLGSAALDVSAIDQSSMRVEGVAPHRIHGGDFNEDGIPDLKLFLDTPSMLAGLDARLTAAAARLPAPVAATVEPTLTAPTFTVVQVAEALLGGGAAYTREQTLAMDRSGNANGRLDIGDLRAAVMADAGIVVMAKGGNGKGGGGEGGNNGNDGVPPETEVLVLTGALHDGTPFWAEDSAVIKGVAR